MGVILELKAQPIRQIFAVSVSPAVRCPGAGEEAYSQYIVTAFECQVRCHTWIILSQRAAMGSFGLSLSIVKNRYVALVRRAIDWFVAKYSLGVIWLVA